MLHQLGTRVELVVSCPGVQLFLEEGWLLGTRDDDWERVGCPLCRLLDRVA